MLWGEDEGNQYGLAPLVAGSPHPKAIPETALLPYGVPRPESNSLAEREERELFQQMLRAQAQDAITRKAKAQQAYEARHANRSSRAVKEQWAEGMEAFRNVATESTVDEPPPKKRAREASSERPEGEAPREGTFVLTPLGSRAASPVIERRRSSRRRRRRSRSMRSRRKGGRSKHDSGSDSDSDSDTQASDKDAEGEEDSPVNEAGQPMDEDVTKTTPVDAAASS